MLRSLPTYDDLHVALLNEQGKGEGPHPDWGFEPSQQSWLYTDGHTRRVAAVTRRETIGGWDWQVWQEGALTHEGKGATARAAMQAATEAMT